jgi:ABC-type branched-subunit amino acid transport system ATPase component
MAPTIATMLSTSVPRIKPKTRFRISALIASIFVSGGKQQMLTIARTLTGNPELLLLDEPSEGLAPLVVETLRIKIGELKAQGLTVLLAEQRVPSWRQLWGRYGMRAAGFLAGLSGGLCLVAARA